MNPKQKRKIGIVLLALSLTLMAAGAGFTIYCLKVAVRVPAGIGTMLIVVLMPLWVIGIMLVSQAKKEEDAR